MKQQLKLKPYKMKTTKKRFQLKTGNGINDMLIHSTMEREMYFDNEKEAVAAYKKECTQLKNEYGQLYDPPYGHEHESDSVHTELLELENGEYETVNASDVYWL